MSTNKTQNYNLNQWVKSDRVLMSEFNADNAKIDAAVKAVDNRVDSLSSTVAGKASASALSSLTTTVNGLKTSKADKTTVDNLTQTVAQHTLSIAKLGDCLFHTTSYTGTGTRDASNPPSLTFPHRPMVVFISAGNRRLTLVQGSSSYVGSDGNGAAVTAAWSGNSVSWTSQYDYAWMNNLNTTYSVVALLDAKH